MFIFRKLLIRVFAVLVGVTLSSHAYAFLYPIAHPKPFFENSTGALWITSNASQREVAGEEGDRRVPYKAILQPAHWLASDPSRIYAHEPVNNCSWFCIPAKSNDTIATLAAGWKYTEWSNKVLIPNAAGSQICSGIIIRTDRAAGLVTNPFYVGPSFDGACGYAYAKCLMDMPGPAALIHGEISEAEADGHTASTQLKIRCNGKTWLYMRLLPGNGVDGEDRIKLSNGGKSRLFLNGSPISSTLKLEDGINTVKLSDQLEIPADAKLGEFTGNAVLLMQMY